MFLDGQRVAVGRAFLSSHRTFLFSHLMDYPSGKGGHTEKRKRKSSNKLWLSAYQLFGALDCDRPGLGAEVLSGDSLCDLSFY